MKIKGTIRDIEEGKQGEQENNEKYEKITETMEQRITKTGENEKLGQP